MLVTALGAARASAAEDASVGASPWFPVVDPAVGPQQTFESNTLEIIRVGDEGWRADRGTYRANLTRHDFYVTVGRADLASSQSASLGTSRALWWGGYASVVVGGVLLYAHFSPGGFNPGVAPGLICLGGGIAAVWASSWFTGPSISPAEAEQMADRYNKLLRAHIEQETGETRPKPVQALAPRVLPWTDGRSGGLVAFAAF